MLWLADAAAEATRRDASGLLVTMPDYAYTHTSLRKRLNGRSIRPLLLVHLA